MPEQLEFLPIAGFYVVVALLMLASGEAGYQYGARTRTSRDKEAPVSLGPMVGGLLGMLAFVLAFSFSLATAQHDRRKENVLEEANAIGTAYLRADLIADSHGAEVRQLLREYVDIRLEAASGGDLDLALMRSAEVHRGLWEQVSAVATASPDTNTALLVQSVNDVIDMHGRRVSGALRNRIPGSVWIALIAIVVLTMMTLGAQVGLTGKRRLVAVIPLVLAFAVLVTLVVDLDRPRGGLITVQQQSMIDLRSEMADEAK